MKKSKKEKVDVPVDSNADPVQQWKKEHMYTEINTRICINCKHCVRKRRCFLMHTETTDPLDECIINPRGRCKRFAYPIVEQKSK